MKRWVRLAAVLLGCCLLLTVVGCTAGKSETTPPVTDCFTCRITAQYHDLSLAGQLSRLEDGKMLVTFTEPTSLSGVAIGWDGTKMSMELAGMSIAVDEQKVPQSALVKRLLQLLTAPHEGGTMEQEGLVTTGEIDGLAYTMVSDPHTGLLRSLSLPEEALQVTFSETSLLTDSD